jgi:hypothetical protein
MVTPPSTSNKGVRVSTAWVCPGTVIGGTSFTYYVNLSAPAPAGGQQVNITSTDGSVVSHKFNLTVPAGQVTGVFSVPTKTVTSTTPVTLQGSANGGSANVVVTVTPN